MKNKYIIILIFLGFVTLVSSIKGYSQKPEKKSKMTISGIVKDESGNPIPRAEIFGNEGIVVVKADETGKFSISISENSDLLIEAEGFEPKLFFADKLPEIKEFQLKATEFLYGKSNNVNIAFGKIKQGDLVGSVSIVNPSEISPYDNVQGISSGLLGRIPGMLGSSNIRGIGTPLFIVDGLPRDVSTINFLEVEQITVLKDINASILYGNAAVNGVVLVTTKRGQAHKKQINITGYYGISLPKALPKFLSSADYMTLFNEARLNDGLSAQYDATTISNYASGNKYRYPNVDYYSSEYLRSFKPYFKAISEFSGGNEVATYYSSLGWDRQGSLLDFGEGADANYNRFSMRGNVDININQFIRSSIDAVALFSNDRGPVSNYWTNASALRPHLFTPLLPFDLINPKNVELVSRKNDVNGIYLLGGTTSNLKNPIADGYSGGVNENIERTFSFNNRIDFDLNKLVKGLTFHTNLSFDFYTGYDQAVINKYSVYNPTWGANADSIVSLTKLATDERSGTQNVGNSIYVRRFGFYGMFDYDRTFNEVHHISGSLIGFGSKYKKTADLQGQKNVNLSMRLTYNYNKKYMIDFSSAIVNSVKLPENSRVAFSPSLGLAWVLSSEDFMSSLKSVDYLKIRLSGGILNSDTGIDGFFFYDDKYQSSGAYSWFENAWSNSGVISGYGPNSKLAFEKRKELNFGFEGLFFNRFLGLEANIFTSEYADQVVRPQTKYPSFDIDFIPYENFESNTYQGAEIGLTLNKSIGDFSFMIGANALYANSKVKIKDEVYSNDYQYRAGKPIDALFGLVADGFFRDAADIADHSIQAFGTVTQGDIKYIDQNKDGIVDANDEIQIGRSQVPYSYNVDLKLNYRNFTLFALGTGQMGSDSYIQGDYYWVDGNDKYSEYVMNRWTPATAATATFPRLSSVANTNNFRQSTFWLYRNNAFTIQRVQLTYAVPEAIASKLLMKNLSVFAAGSSLLTISKNRNITELNVASEPQYRSFSLGIKAMF